MSGPASPPPPRLPGHLADDLRADLADGYTMGGVEEMLGPVAVAALEREEPVAARRATAAATAPAAVLTRLFLLGRPVTRAALDAALPRTTTAGAQAAGLVTVAGSGATDEVRPLVVGVQRLPRGELAQVGGEPPAAFAGGVVHL